MLQVERVPWKPVAPRQDVRRNLLENAAKRLYGTWAHEVGLTTAWEQLPPRHRQAFLEITKGIAEDPTCECGENLFCLDCDRDLVYECPTCLDKLTCERCERAPRRRFRFKPDSIGEKAMGASGGPA